MKNHREMFEALLDGETLEEFDGYTLILQDGDLVYKNKDGLIATLGNLSLRKPTDWKIKPKTININGFEVPEPVKQPLPNTTIYFIPNLSALIDTDAITDDFGWRSDDNDFLFLSRGIIHLTREAAELHAKALLSFTRKG